MTNPSSIRSSRLHWFLLAVTFVIALSAVVVKAFRTSSESQFGRIVFDSFEIELGELAVSAEPYPVLIPIHNSGRAPLRITRIATSCACADARISDSQLLPDESATLRIDVRRSVAEERDAVVYVSSTDPHRPTVPLTLTWRVAAPLAFQPYRIDVGHLAPGAEFEQTVRLERHYDAEGASLPITRFQCFPETDVTAVPLDALHNPVADLSQAEAFAIRIRARGDRGKREGRVVAFFGDEATAISLPVYWKVSPLVEVSPTRLSFGSGLGHQEVSRTVMIRSTAEPLSVESAVLSVDGEYWTVSPETLSSHSLRLNISGRLPEEIGPLTGECVVHFARPPGQVLRIPVSGVVIHNSHVN